MSLTKYVYSVKPIRVIDGDTIEVNVDLGWEIHRMTHIRMNGVNAPEHNTPNGPIATKFFQDLIFPRDHGYAMGEAIPCIFRSDAYDKYGRTVGHLWFSGETNQTEETSINAQLEKHYVETGISVKFHPPIPKTGA